MLREREREQGLQYYQGILIFVKKKQANLINKKAIGK